MFQNNANRLLNAFRILCDFGCKDDDDAQKVFLRKKYLLGILGACHIDDDNYEKNYLKLPDI